MIQSNITTNRYQTAALGLLFLLVPFIPFTFQIEVQGVRLSVNALLIPIISLLTLLSLWEKAGSTPAGLGLRLRRVWDQVTAIPYFLAWLIFVVLSVISRAIGPEITGPVQGIWHIYRVIIEMPLIYLLVVLNLTGWRDWRRLALVLVIATSLSAAIGIVQSVSGGQYLSGYGEKGNLRYLGFLFPYPSDIQEIIRKSDPRQRQFYVPGTKTLRAYGGVTNHINLGGFLCATVPLTLALFWQPQRWWQRLALLLGLGVQVIALVLTYSRAAWVGLILAIFGISLLIAGKRFPLRLLVIGLSTMLIAGLAAWLSLDITSLTTNRGDVMAYRLGTLLQPLQTPEIAGRILAWQKSLDVIVAHPLLGQGKDAVPGLIWWGAPGSSHNLFLHLAMARGLVAFAAFMVLFIGLFVSGARLYRKATTSVDIMLAAGLLAALAAFSLAGLFASLVSYADTGALFWLLAGLVVVADRVTTRHS